MRILFHPTVFHEQQKQPKEILITSILANTNSVELGSFEGRGFQTSHCFHFAGDEPFACFRPFF